MSTEQNKETIRRAMSALGRGDFTGFLADFTDDCTFTIMGLGASPLQGKPAVRKFLDDTLGTLLVDGAIAMTIENLIAEGDSVVEQAWGKSQTKTGNPYDNTYCRVWRFTDGKIKSMTEYLDTELARRAIEGR